MSEGLSRAGEPLTQESSGQFMTKLSKTRASGPWRLFGGPATSVPTETAGADADAEFLRRIDHVRLDLEEGPVHKTWNEGIMKLFRKRRQESAMEFVARTGLGPAQAATMTKNEITAFVAQAMRNHADEWHPPVARFRGAIPKSKSTVVDTESIEPAIEYMQGDPGVAL